MKKILVLSAILTLIASFVAGCNVATPNKIAADQYYVQIQGTGEMKDNRRFYTLPAYDEDGVEKKVTFSSVKSKNEQLQENAFLRLYVRQGNTEKIEILDTEVKSYEEVEKEDLPKKIKEKFGVN
ncbi:YxeA family protein [Lysinibacillus xylanilyticus]|uniref:YxeA family protein n=1 Tax=Lysinibacillus xylanilyticus TaxID=582475 RepID=UPI00381058D6